jgi:hypothetical protein
MNEVGRSVGQMGFLFLLNSAHAHIMTENPSAAGTAPHSKQYQAE